jgi:ribonuclease HI
LLACIKGLQTLKRQSSVVVYSDSKYVVYGLTKGWARKWRANNWQRNENDKAQNVDLWSQLLDLCETHEVEFVWVKGHAGNPENERCDRLATQAARGKVLATDPGFQI